MRLITIHIAWLIVVVFIDNINGLQLPIRLVDLLNTHSVHQHDESSKDASSLGQHHNNHMVHGEARSHMLSGAMTNGLAHRLLQQAQGTKTQAGRSSGQGALDSAGHGVASTKAPGTAAGTLSAGRALRPERVIGTTHGMDPAARTGDQTGTGTVDSTRMGQQGSQARGAAGGGTARGTGAGAGAGYRLRPNTQQAGGAGGQYGSRAGSISTTQPTGQAGGILPTGAGSVPGTVALNMVRHPSLQCIRHGCSLAQAVL